MTVGDVLLFWRELKSLERFVTMYLDYVEDQTEINIPITEKLAESARFSIVG